MAGLRFTELQTRPMEFLDFTSVTLDEFQQLVPPFEDAFHARMAAWRMDGKPRTARRFTVYKNCPLPTPEDRCCSSWSTSKPMPSRWCTGAYSGWSRAKPISGFTCSCPRCWPRCAPSAMPRPIPHGSRATAGCFGGGSKRTAGRSPSTLGASRRANVPRPLAGTERRIVRPQDPPAQTDCYSGKKKDHTLKNVLLVNALLVILFLSDTHGGVSMICASRRPPYFQPGVGCCRIWASCHSRSRRSKSLCRRRSHAVRSDLEQQRATQVLNQQRLRIEHVNSGVKRCRIVKDRIRLWKAGVRDLVMELCCALHNFRVRLNRGCHDLIGINSIVELGLRHGEQIALLAKIQDILLTEQSGLIDHETHVCPTCGNILKKNGYKARL